MPAVTVQTDASAVNSHLAKVAEVSMKGRNPYQRVGHQRVSGAVPNVSDATVRATRRKNEPLVSTELSSTIECDAISVPT